MVCSKNKVNIASSIFDLAAQKVNNSTTIFLSLVPLTMAKYPMKTM